MRILLWHGWLLEGSGSNVYTARVAETLRAQGHDVLLLCQEPHADRYRWIDAAGTVGADGVTGPAPNAADPSPGGACCCGRGSAVCCPCSSSTSTRASR